MGRDPVPPDPYAFPARGCVERIPATDGLLCFPLTLAVMGLLTLLA